MGSKYAEDLSIDKFSLDEELVKQPGLALKYGELLADSIAERDRAKENLDVVKAELDAKIRNNFEDYGFEKKPTEAAIFSWILTQEEYKEANKDYIEKKKEVAIFESAKEAVNHKKRALSDLVQLFIANYFSSVPLPKEKKGEVENLRVNKNKEDQSRMKKKLKLKRNK